MTRLPKDITTSGSQNEEQESIERGEVEETEGESGEAPEEVNEDEDVKFCDGEVEVVNQDMIQDTAEPIQLLDTWYPSTKSKKSKKNLTRLH